MRLPQRKAKHGPEPVLSPEQATVVELRRLAKVIAYATIRNEPDGEQALFLDGVGYTSPEIAEMLGITPSHARTLISRARKAKKKRKRKQTLKD